REYGVDVDELPVENSIDKLNTRPALTIVLAAALDDWTFVRRQVAHDDWAWGSRRLKVPEAGFARWKRLVTIARGIDSEPLREQIRAAWSQPRDNVRDEVRRLADSIDVRAQPPATLIILARGMVGGNAVVRILQEARQLHPEDFWLNFELGNMGEE